MTTTPEPTLSQLWSLIERDSERTRADVRQALDDIRAQLDSFMTKELWLSERTALLHRLEKAEADLREQERKHEELRSKLEREATEAHMSRSQSTRDFVYKGIIPAFSLLVAALALFWAA